MLTRTTPMSAPLFGMMDNPNGIVMQPTQVQMLPRVHHRVTFDEMVTRFTETSLPSFDRKACDALPEKVPLHNFTKEDYGNVLYRCESANKEYPTIVLNDTLRAFPSLWITVQLYNASTKANMRTPNLKTKSVEKYRFGDGLLVRANTQELSFKKKSVKNVTVSINGEQRTVAKDFAFSLSRRFASFTDGEDAQFVFIVVPFDGRFLVDKAVRSEPFTINSKRQENRLGKRAKRRKRNVYIEKLDTDIHCAQCTLNQLNHEAERRGLMVKQFDTCFQQLNRLVRLRSLKDPTMRLALEFALRDVKEEETASL